MGFRNKGLTKKNRGKSSTSSNSKMSSRGRGFNSRGGGSYRGRGGGGNWDSGSGGNNMNRGGYGSSRGGRFKYSTPSYESRSKYNSSGASDRSYSSRGARGDHSNNYKRQRDSYSSRDDHRSSSESNRKRVRNDGYQGDSSSGSQRYPSSYGGSATSTPYNENKRSSSSAVYDDKRPSDRSSSYHRSDERHSSASRNYAAPPPPRISEMAPPSQRYNSSNRGRISHQTSNYRGRITSRGRASFRVGASRSELLSRKRGLTSTVEYRRKLLNSRSRDYIQRVRLATTKIRRSGTNRLSGSKKESTTGSSMKDKDRELAKAINAEFSDDDDEDKDVEENWDVDDKTLRAEDDDVDNEAETDKKSKDDKRKKDKAERQNVDEHEEEKDEEMKENEVRVKREGEDDEEREEGRNENEKEEGGESDDLPNRRNGKRFIKLHCPHCAHRSVTFKEYSLHLFSGRHNTAMRRIAARHKATLARMRVLQRQEQRRHEAREASRGTLPSRTIFCQICKLNYRSLKAMHHMSDSHRQMKRFLTPFCRVCRIQFRSPMLFETHACSLDHIKRKSVTDGRLPTGNGDAEGDSSAPEEDDKEVNLDNFMTLDSVGDVDAEGDEETGEKKKVKKEPESEATPPEPEKMKPKNKQMIKVGSEYIKSVEVQFCELCKVYLPRNENSERAVALHCSTRSHLKRYVRDNDDKALRRQAERIHLQTSSSTNTTSPNSTINSDNAKLTSTNSQETSSNASSIPANADPSTTPEKNSEPTTNATDTVTKSKLNSKDVEEEEEDDYHNDGDKLWEDVDKDLGDILREVEPGKSSDDEDSRYDRFKNSEKKAQHNKEKINDAGEIEKTKKNDVIKTKIEETEN